MNNFGNCDHLSLSSCKTILCGKLHPFITKYELAQMELTLIKETFILFSERSPSDTSL